MFRFFSSEKFYLPIIYIIVGILIYIVIAKTITSISKINIKHSKGIDKRKTTVIVLINNIIKYVIAFIVIIMILNLYGVNTTSLIASLGAVTVIVGLAFQDIIKDFLAGIFIIFDNAYAVGDWVKINDFTGEVVSLGLKTTKIKAYTGEVKILSNSSFSEVINYNLNHSKIVLQIPIGYDVDIDKVESVLNNIKKQIDKNKNVYGMELLGIDSFESSSLNYAIVIECYPMTQIGVKREVLKIIKKAFDNEGIIIPYNQLDVHIEK
ncbi:MAG: mechanosensitive ion channel family protein [Erysipelotrichaceae bacterium]|nr:mechanosensitive ion channel family protein [Erysipelotrichaceae bacterium]